MRRFLVPSLLIALVGCASAPIRPSAPPQGSQDVYDYEPSRGGFAVWFAGTPTYEEGGDQGVHLRSWTLGEHAIQQYVLNAPASQAQWTGVLESVLAEAEVVAWRRPVPDANLPTEDALIGLGADRLRLRFVIQGTRSALMILMPAADTERSPFLGSLLVMPPTAGAEAAWTPILAACREGRESACVALVFLNAADISASRHREAASVLLASCERGERGGCVGEGIALAMGNGLPRDRARARQRLEPACETKGPFQATACANAGTTYIEESGVSDWDKALAYSRRACEGKESIGCLNLGLLLQAEGTHQDLPGGAEALAKACEIQPSSCHELAAAYWNGRGVEKDAERAAALNFRACVHGNAPICEQLISSYREAYEGGTRGVGLPLGALYWDGIGVPSNHEEALRLWEGACEDGVEQACALVEKNGPAAAGP